MDKKSKPPVWKGNVLYVWSDYYQSYIANYSIPTYQRIAYGLSVDEWKKIIGLDDIKEVE